MGRSWERAEEVRQASGRPVIGPYLGRIIESVSERLIPEGGLIPVSMSETGAYPFLARYLGGLDPGARLALKALFVAFDLGPFLFIGRFCRFVNLSPEEQDLYLADWEASRIYYRRMVLVLLKTLAGMGFYNDPQVQARMGFELPCQKS